MKEWGSSTLLTNGMTDLDQRVRIAAFNWLDEQVGIHGDVLPRSILSQGFEFVKGDVHKKVNNSTHPALIRFCDGISRATNVATTTLIQSKLD